MSDRADLTDRFLAATRWAGATRTPLAGDASARRYQRLIMPETGESSVLMDAPPDQDQGTAAFVAVAGHLADHGFSAPKVLAQDIGQGLLLLEDFGNGMFARLIETDPGLEEELYAAAVDVLAGLGLARKPAGLVEFTPRLMSQQAGLVFETYACLPDRKVAFMAELETLLHRNLIGPRVLILRDYHAENLIWLPDRDGLRCVGLLDFQDAMIGPAGYDLVSLLFDARRDVSPELATRMGVRFVEATGIDAKAFEVTRAILSAQRNLRILAVFARLARDHGKTGYVDLIPRVWSHLMAALDHQALSGLRMLVADLPEPTVAHLNALRVPCK